MRGVMEKLKEFSQKGDLKAISYKLEKSGQQGMFSDKQVLRDMLECVANNVHAKAAWGKSYKALVQQFFEVVLIWGGPRFANFVARICSGQTLTRSTDGVRATRTILNRE